MRVVCIADTHCRHWTVLMPPADILLHAGDLTDSGTIEETSEAMRWLGMLPYRHKIFVAGNHDWLFAQEPTVAAALVPPGVRYLEDSGCVIEGLTIWGTPVQPRFCDLAFNKQRGAEIDRHWAMIPRGTNLLVTHCAPHGSLDVNSRGEHLGCEMLAKRLSEIRPHLAVFGHIHEAYGLARMGPTLLVNAAICDRRGQVAHDPIVVEI